MTDASVALLDLYDAHVGRVYGYLFRRCADRAIAEELTSETFMAALSSLRGNPPRTADVSWLLGIARHKLIDHWRRRARDERNLLAVGAAETQSSWSEVLEAGLAEEVLTGLPPQYRMVLTLRYLDDLSVPTIAELLERSVHSAESLLARARRAFRDSYRAKDEGRDES